MKRDERCRESQRHHVMHVWINRGQEARRQNGEAREPDLYEWKNILGELQHLPYWLHAAHQHASYRHSPRWCSRGKPRSDRPPRIHPRAHSYTPVAQF